jgi:hypothetical protein
MLAIRLQLILFGSRMSQISVAHKTASHCLLRLDFGRLIACTGQRIDR